MEHVRMPLDVQDKIYDEISALKQLEQNQIAALIETHSHSQIHERLAY